jgi:hypothetical protein
MTAHQVAAVMARCQQANPGTRRYWLTEYGCWAWGNPDMDRRAEGGPCDGIRYGTAMAEWTLTDPQKLTETRAAPVHDGQVRLVLLPYSIGTLTLREKPQPIKPETLVFADPEAPVPSKGKLLLSENFDAKLPERWRTSDATISLQTLLSSEHTLVTGQDLTLWSKRSFPVEKVMDIRFRFQQESGEICPVLWALPEEGRFLQAQILPTRCALHRFDHGFHELPNTVPLALKPGEWHQLQSARIMGTNLYLRPCVASSEFRYVCHSSVRSEAR